MKKLIYVYFFLLLFSTEINSQWDLVYPDIPADHINDLVFINEDNGFFANEAGDLLTTDDGGITWEIIKYYPEHSIKEIKFLDQLNGFGFINKNFFQQGDVPFIYTTDGGVSWKEAQISMLDAITFLPISTIQLIKSVYDGIEKLDNFFNQWRYTFNMPTFLAGDSLYQWEEVYGNIHQFQKLSSGRILALGSSWNALFYEIISDSVSFILSSDDLAENWDTLWCDLPYNLTTMSFANDSIGFVGGEQERIYKTSDGGISWTLVYSSAFGSIFHIYALDEMNIYATQGNDFIYSTDGGSSWQETTLPSYGSFKLLFMDNLHGFAFGGDFLMTSDGGENWERVSKSIKDDIAKIDFVSKKTGWALSYYSLYKTSDAGYTWHSQFSFDGVWNWDMGLEMLDSFKGFISTPYNVYCTMDGGEVWDSLELGEDIHFLGGVTFFDDNLGIIYGALEEEIPGSHNYNVPSNFITTDGGSSWGKITYPVGSEYVGVNKMKFTDPEHLWSINRQGIWLSKDTAQTWQPVYNVNYFVGGYSFDFIDSLNGVLARSYGEIILTSDGGETWENKSLSRGIQFRDVQMVGTDIFGRYRIFLTGDKGRVTKYVPGVMPDENHYPTYTMRKINSISLFMEDRLPYLWFAGEGFTILKGNTELVVDVEEIETDFIASFELHQNYPNPFNPATVIRYELPELSNVSLKVYDVLGNEVANLINEEKEAGIYEVEFDAKNLASGIYLYKFQAGKFVKTQKMVLLR